MNLRLLAHPNASALALLACAALFPLPTAAQRTEPLRAHAGGYLGLAQPRGEFSSYVEVGGGIAGFVRVGLDRAGILSLRLQGEFLNYGSETKRVCLSTTIGCRIQVDLTTSNNIVFVGVGPELGIPLGGVRLYGNSSAGFSFFSTDSQVRGSSSVGDDPFASSHNYGDAGFAWTLGGGLSFGLLQADRFPISLDLGVTHHGNGRREYLTEGGIIDRPDGSIEYDVRRSEANYLLWHLGVSVGIAPDRLDEPN